MFQRFQICIRAGAFGDSAISSLRDRDHFPERRQTKFTLVLRGYVTRSLVVPDWPP